MHQPLSEAFIINIVNAFGSKLVENWNCFMEAESGRAVKCAAPDRLLTTPHGLDYITLGWNEDDSKWYWDWHHNLMNHYQVASVHIVSILPPNSYDSIFKRLNFFKNLDVQAIYSQLVILQFQSFLNWRSPMSINGLMAQWITRLTTDQKIQGSNPGELEIFWPLPKSAQIIRWPVSQPRVWCTL